LKLASWNSNLASAWILYVQLLSNATSSQC
jgi:hypothetical protein